MKSVTTRIGATLIACWMVLGGLGAGCSTETTQGDLEKWTQNEAGSKRIAELVADPSTPRENKIRALIAVVHAGQSSRLRPLIESTSEPDAVAEETANRLLSDLSTDSHAVRAKNGLLHLIGMLPEASRDPIRKSVAAWAFDGLDRTTPTSVIKKQIEHRILPNQIIDLNKHGAEGAALLISRGFAVEQMFRFLLSFEEETYDRMALQALMSLQTIPEVQMTHSHLERVSRVELAESVLYLLRIYDTATDRDIGMDAFNKANALLEKPAVREEAEKLVPTVEKYLSSRNPDDRWFGATTVVKLTGVQALPKAFVGLRDDGVYDTGALDPLESAIAFCEFGIRQLGKPPTEELVRVLESGNRVQKSVAILCLKGLARPESNAALAAVTADATDISNVWGVSVKLGALAQNAIDGGAYLRLLESELNAGRVKADEYATKRLAALQIVDKTGEAYTEAVGQRVGAQ